MSPKQRMMTAALELYEGKEVVYEQRDDAGNWSIEVGRTGAGPWEFTVVHRRRGAARRIMAATLRAALEEGFGIA